MDLADARSESPGESRTRLLLGSLRLGTAVPQVEIRDAEGYLVGRVDFLYEQQRTIVEFDGLVKYGDADGRVAVLTLTGTSFGRIPSNVATRWTLNVQVWPRLSGQHASDLVRTSR